MSEASREMATRSSTDLARFVEGRLRTRTDAGVRASRDRRGAAHSSRGGGADRRELHLDQLLDRFGEQGGAARQDYATVSPRTSASTRGGVRADLRDRSRRAGAEDSPLSADASCRVRHVSRAHSRGRRGSGYPRDPVPDRQPGWLGAGLGADLACDRARSAEGQARDRVVLGRGGLRRLLRGVGGGRIVSHRDADGLDRRLRASPGSRRAARQARHRHRVAHARPARGLPALLAKALAGHSQALAGRRRAASTRPS